MIPKQFIFIFIILLICEAEWVIYSQHIGYMPSYTYSLNLTAGDTFRAVLSWPTTADFDIYLYSNGSNILNRAIRLAG
jgi:hypothetical protein